MGGLGIVVMSTPEGLMTGQEAKTKNLGGEAICKIW
ncbi:30S ribosomal protein S8 [Patescibacteria group bacterium]|nr:30S ribosomal protein S8 [Patescibacteria group bacterium]